MEEEWRENIKDTRCSVDGRKRYGNDKCGRESF